MRALLHDLILSFESEDEEIIAGWRKLFDLEIAAAADLPGDTVPDIRLRAVCVPDIPQPPRGRPSYTEPPRAGHGRAARYYPAQNGGVLDLARPAQIAFDFETFEAQIALTKQVLDAGNLEDLSLIALAPFLRRRGFYMAHAFSVGRGTAVLICGPSGSGKTTTGLALVEDGWHYLGNDVSLLAEDAHGRVIAYPSPGGINLHPHTLELLPAYRDRLQPGSALQSHGKFILSRGDLLHASEQGSPVPVSTILFPAITDQASFSLHELTRAIGMARLIEETVDQWDRDTYEAHINLLTRLSLQVDFLSLALPRGRSPSIFMSDGQR